MYNDITHMTTLNEITTTPLSLKGCTVKCLSISEVSVALL